VKTLDLMISTVATLCIVTLLGASSWSPDSMVSFQSLWWQVLVFSCFSLFIFDLLCKRSSWPPCISSSLWLYL
jgi:hypothetical protein